MRGPQEHPTGTAAGRVGAGGPDWSEATVRSVPPLPTRPLRRDEMRVLYVARAAGGHVTFSGLSPAVMRSLANAAWELELRGLVRACLCLGRDQPMQPIEVTVDVTRLGEQVVQADWLC